MIQALAWAKAPSDELRVCYQTVGDKAGLQRLETFERQASRFRDDFLKAIEADKLSPEQAKAALLGEEHPRKEARQRMEEVLNDAGLRKSSPDARDSSE